MDRDQKLAARSRSADFDDLRFVFHGEPCELRIDRIQTGALFPVDENPQGTGRAALPAAGVLVELRRDGETLLGEQPRRAIA